MWCKHCRQDVAAISARAADAVRCARCGMLLTHPGEPTPGPAKPKRAAVIGDRASSSSAPEKSIASEETSQIPQDARLVETANHGIDLSSMRVESKTAPKPDPVDWGLEQDIRRIKRESASQASENIETKMGRNFRIDLPQLPAEPILPQTSATSQHLATRVRLPRKSRRSLWPLATFGLILFGVGTSLLAASTFGDFPLLWAWGMPLTLAGQAGVLLGVVLYLDRIGRTGQTAVERLEQVDDHIQGLEQTTRMLSTTHSTPSQAFYSHFAAGADPKILLTDVKGQLDLLAQRMSQR